MRLSRFHLARYGIFTDRSIALPAARPDIHLIVGPNEAGKSTLRAAISDLLFGIEPRSAFNFIHNYKEMRLGATVDDGAESIAFTRLKRNKQALRDADDNPLPDDLLTAHLGSADRVFFERMFGLDHTKLVDGGDEILEAKDDVARMLFEASAGLASLGEFRDRLEAEAKGLWDKRKSKDRAYYKALEIYEAAKAAMKEATSRVSVWKKAKRRVQDARAALEEAARHLAELEIERGRLERIRRVAPHLRKRNEELAKKAAFGAAILLPAGAAEDLESATGAIADAEAQITKHQTLVEKAHRTREKITVDEPLLARREDIAELEGVRHRVKDFTGQIEKRETEVQVLMHAVERLVRELGWEGTDEEGLTARIPAQIVRAEIDQLLRDHGRLEEAASNTAGMLADKDEVIANRELDMAALPAAGAPAALMSCLVSARGLGDVDGRKGELVRRKREASGLLDDAMKQLQPWKGDTEALRSLVVPSEENVRDIQARMTSVAQKQTALQDQLAAARDELEREQLEKQQLQRTKSPVASEDIEASRVERDGLWSKIRSGGESLDDVGDDYESKVATADALSDRRYRDAAEVERLEILGNRIEKLQLDLRSHEKRHEEVCGDRESIAGEWAQLMETLGLGEMPILSFLTWRNQRDKALEAAATLGGVEAELRDLEQRETNEATALCEALALAGLAKTDIAGLELGGLINLAERVSSEAEAAKANRAQLERQQTQDRRELQGLQKKADTAAAALKKWSERWAEQVQAASLAAGVGRAGAATALKLFADLDDKLKSVNDLRRTRIATMQRDLDSFNKRAAELVAAVAPDLAGEPAERSIATLSERLKAVEAARDSLTAAREDLAENEEARDNAALQHHEAQRKIQPLLDAAKVANVAELSLAIRRSDELRAIDKAVADETREALDGGDGLSLEQLEQERAQEDLTKIELRLAELKSNARDATETRDACLLEKKEAEEERDQIGGQADAASAAARSEEALAEMTSAVERYLKVVVAARLLRWSIDRYREEKQAPLLQRASEIFATLTLGSFEKLTVDFDSSTPRLVGRRPGGKHTQVDGMSEGTRDQLYMALRMAAVEMQTNHGQALPFIADDLFINYDDDRAAAGFAVLAQLSQRTQVIFLTHHTHLVPVAKNVLGAELNVVFL